MTRKSVAVLWGVLLTLVVVAAPAVAQTAASVRSVIPFEFSVGKTLVPAGEYVIRFDRQFEALSFTAVDNGARISMPARCMNSGPDDVSEARVVFNRYGDSYFLSQVWDGSRSGPYSVSPSKAERELARIAPAAPVTMLARR